MNNKFVARFFQCIAVAVCVELEPATAAEWVPAVAPLMTRWAQEVTATNVWPEYPRPQLQRTAWLNLNGLWDYGITPDTIKEPSSFTGRILVPYPLESALSGVGRSLGPQSKLWYRREFSLPSEWAGKRVRLHFGAVDWQCRVWVNNQYHWGAPGRLRPVHL